MRTNEWLVLGAIFLFAAGLFHLTKENWTESLQWFAIAMLALLIAIDHKSR